MSHRPVTLLRTNSMDPQPTSRVGFSLPQHHRTRVPKAVHISEVECGSGIIPRACINCCCPPERCNHGKLASPQTFAAVLVVLLIIHGATEGYLAEILPTIVVQFRLSVKLTEWILVAHKLSQVIVGIFVAHTASKNRPTRLGGYLALAAVTCGTLVTPYFEHGDIKIKSSVTSEGPHLCNSQYEDSYTQVLEMDKNTCWVMVALLFLYQFLSGACATALMSHGITYIDDNVEKINSPAYIGAAFGLGYIGRKLGSLIGWICLGIPLSSNATSKSVLGSWWLGWPYLSAILLAGAITICLFPSLMPSTAVKNAAKTILYNLREESRMPYAADESTYLSEGKIDDSILPESSLGGTLGRLLHNKMIILSITSSIFLEAGLYNFLSIEEVYLESVYQIPKKGALPGHNEARFDDPWVSRLTTGMLKAPLIAMTVIISGLILSRFKPKASSIAAWTASMALLAGVMVLITLLMVCPATINGEKNGRLDVENMCNMACHCDEKPTNTMLIALEKYTTAVFTPVCDEENKETYFSPCHAGCKTSDHIRNNQVFENCSCITSNSGHQRATLGPCIIDNSAACRFGWIFFQVSLIIIQVVIASGMVGKVLLCLRCVLPQDKPMVFGLEMAVISFFVYVPFKLLYKYLTDLACMSWTEMQMCQLHQSKMLALSVNILTSCLFLISGIFMVWVAIVARGLELYQDDEEESSIHDAGEDEVNDPDENTLREQRSGTPWPARKRKGKKGNKENILQQSGLLHMIVSRAPPRNDIDTENKPSPDSPGEEEQTNTTEL